MARGEGTERIARARSRRRRGCGVRRGGVPIARECSGVPLARVAEMSGAGKQGAKFFLLLPDKTEVKLRQVSFWSDADGASVYFRADEQNEITKESLSLTAPTNVSE